MKALILCGSGNKDGFTWKLCAGTAAGLESSGLSVRTVDVLDYEVDHCTGCGRCSGGNPCPKEDGMAEIMSYFSEADLLILATPIRFSGPSSEIKTVLDRFQPLWHGSGLKCPGYAAGILCGGSVNARFAPSVTIFKAFAITAKMEWLGELTVSGTDSMEFSPESSGSEEFGRNLAERIRNGGR